MGFLDWLLPASTTLAERMSTADEMTTIPSLSGDVAQVAALPPGVAEAFGINVDSDRVTRAQAMTIPSVRRGRQIIAGTLGTAPLVATRSIAGKPPERVPRQIIAQPDPNTTRQYTLTSSIDDLLFYGVSWWRVLERESLGFPARAERVAPHRITVDVAQGTVRIDGELVNPRDLIRFDGPDEGILVVGARALRTYILLEEAVRNFSRLDVPLGLIEDEVGQMEDEEVQTFLDSWEVARRKRSTGYLPHGLKYRNPTFNAEQVQLGEAREFQSQEIARLMNLPAQAINAPTNNSMTYSTTESARRDLVDLTFAPFVAALEQRLSMNDVTPNGTTVNLDLTTFLRGDTKQVMDTAKVAIDARLMTVNEIREQWLNLPPLPDTEEGTPNE